MTVHLNILYQRPLIFFLPSQPLKLNITFTGILFRVSVITNLYCPFLTQKTSENAVNKKEPKLKCFQCKHFNKKKTGMTFKCNLWCCFPKVKRWTLFDRASHLFLDFFLMTSKVENPCLHYYYVINWMKAWKIKRKIQ